MSGSIDKDKIILELQKQLAMKDRFLSLITHDLRNPIGSIQLMSESVEKAKDFITKEDLLSEIQEIGETARNVHTLLENLLDWSRVKLDSFPFNPENIDLSFIIKSNVDLFKINTLNKKISVYVEGDDQQNIFADGNMASTIIRNLLSNAIKFTPVNGIIKIIISNNDEFVTIQINDNGVGISEENKIKIFNMDQNLTTRGTENENGSGIGLVLCKEFIDKNGGQIWIESKEGLGTSFYFTFKKSK